jgi:hypothetical protein
MILDAGMKGFSMFELGKVGIFIALAGIIYLFLFSKKLLPANRPETTNEEDSDSSLHLVEAVIGPRFPGINKTVGEFDFKRHYGAEIKELRRSGRTYTNLSEVSFREGDTLVVLTDDSFIQTWGESSVFLMLANGKEYEPAGQWTKIRIEGDAKGTSLFVDGQLQERLEGRVSEHYNEVHKRKDRIWYQETLIFPLKQLGDARMGFKGKVRNLICIPL